MRLATIALGCAAALAAIGGATAQTIVREELRIPMAEAGPRGLEALLVRPNERSSACPRQPWCAPRQPRACRHDAARLRAHVRPPITTYHGAILQFFGAN